MPSNYNKDSEVATNKLLQLLRDNESQEDDTVFVPPDPIDKPVKSTKGSDTKKAKPSTPAIDKPTEESVEKDVTDTDPDIPVDFDSIIEEKYVENQDQIDRQSLADGIPEFEISADQQQADTKSKEEPGESPALSQADMIFQKFALDDATETDVPKETPDQDTAIINENEDSPESIGILEDDAIDQPELIDDDSTDNSETKTSGAVTKDADGLDLIFKDFAGEDDAPPEETETDTDESDIPVTAETTKVDTEDDLDLLFNDDNTDTEIIDTAESSEKRTETDDVSQESVEKSELTFDPVDLPIADDIEEAELETPQKAPDQEETISLEEEEKIVEAQELTERIDEEDFEDALDTEGTEPVTFIYKKEKKFSKDFLLNKLKPSKGRIGLDIGSYAIKYIDAQEAGGITTINDFGYIKIPTEVRADDEATQKFIKSTIKEILLTNQNKKSKLNFLLNGHDVSIKSIHMPKVGKKELKEAVRWSTRKQLSFEADEANLDYKVINDLVEDGIPKLDILVVAAHNALIDKSIDLLSNIKIPAKLTLVPLAAWRAFMSHYPTETANNVMVLDIGHSSTMINVVNKGNLRFAREVGIAGFDFTKSLVGNLNTNTGERIHIDVDKAEELKHKHGLPHGSQESLVTEDGITLEQLSSRIRAPLEKLGNEIQRSMQYYAKEFPYGAVEKIYLCGGSSVMQNLDIFLSETLNHDVIVFDPTSVWNYGSNIADLGNLRINANSLAIPAGIALDTSAELNLLPEKLIQETQNILLKFLVKSFTILVILAILSTSTLSVLRKSSRENEMAGIELKLSQLSPSHKNYNMLLEIKKDKTSKLNSLRSLYNKPTVAVQILKIFSNLIPDHITVNTMVISEPSNKPVKASIDCSGYMLSSAYNAKVELAKFIMELDNSGYIKANSINLKNSYPFEDRNRTGMYFEIEFDIVNNEN